MFLTAMSQKTSTIQLIYHYPKLSWQSFFRRIRTQNSGTVALVQQLVSKRVDLLDGDLIDLLQGMLDTAVLAVVQFAATKPAHPRIGILQSQDDPSAQRALGNTALRFGDAITRHRRKHLADYLHYVGETPRKTRSIHGQRTTIGEDVQRGIH